MSVSSPLAISPWELPGEPVWRFTVEQYHDMILTAILTEAPEGGYVAYNPETGTTTQGETIPEAMDNLREATELYLEEFPLPGQGRALLTTFEVANAPTTSH